MDQQDRILDHCIKTKSLDSAIIYKKEAFDAFFEAMKEEKFSGPFRKPMFTQHSTLIRRAKLSGITMQKSRATGMYFINDPEFIKEVEPVTFNPDLLDLHPDDK